MNRAASSSNIGYLEGVYVGYRFYETADAEGYWNDIDNDYGKGYDGVVQYPFGHGLSYTTFTQEMAVSGDVATGLNFTVTVKNTGSVAGKDVVQLYVTLPYIQGGIEKSRVQLVDFAKTKLLAPGESQTLTFQVDAYSLASFNEAASAWEAAAGVYTVNFGASIQDLRRSGSFKLKKAQSWPVHNVLAPVTE
jgi:beta-glucosidase